MSDHIDPIRPNYEPHRSPQTPPKDKKRARRTQLTPDEARALRVHGLGLVPGTTFTEVKGVLWQSDGGEVAICVTGRQQRDDAFPRFWFRLPLWVFKEIEKAPCALFVAGGVLDNGEKIRIAVPVSVQDTIPRLNGNLLAESQKTGNTHYIVELEFYDDLWRLKLGKGQYIDATEFARQRTVVSAHTRRLPVHSDGDLSELSDSDLIDQFDWWAQGYARVSDELERRTRPP